MTYQVDNYVAFVDIKTKVPSQYRVYKQTGIEAIERLCFLASFGPPGTGKRKGGKKT